MQHFFIVIRLSYAQNIHSYKEDLQPENPSSDDAVTPLTPGFPILPGSPTTPYFNVSGTQGEYLHTIGC